MGCKHRRGGRWDARLRGIGLDLIFGLVGLGLVMFCLAPLAQAAVQTATTPPGGGGASSGSGAAAVQAKASNQRLAATAGAAAARPATEGFVRVPGDAPLGIPADAKATAAAASANDLRRELTVTVALKRTNQAGFNRYLQQVYNRHSSAYRHYLTQAQLASRYGPSASKYDAVRAWLRVNGLRITQTTANRLSISARGTEAQAQRAFDTPIATFKTGRRPVYGNTEAPAVPRSIAGSVVAVTGLSNRAEPTVAPADITDPGATFGVCLASIGLFSPLVTFAANGLAGALAAEIFIAFGAVLTLTLSAVIIGAVVTAVLIAECGALASAASSPPPPPPPPPSCVSSSSGPCLERDTGSDAKKRSALSSRASDPAQKIGLLEFDSYHPSDVVNWLNLVGRDPDSASRLSEVNVNGGVSSSGPGESEVLLDIDTVLGLDPTSDVVVYDAPASTSFVQMFQTMISAGDTVISNSWSQCEDQTPRAEADAIDSVLADAAASGTTVLNGTGDDGSTCSDGSANTIGVPSDSPHATAVGGTTPTLGPGLTYQHESWWDDEAGSPPGGAGGFGVSRYFSRPSFQDGLTSSSSRSVPDLSFNADPEAGIQLCQADDGGCPDNLLWGGTSMAAPEVAAEVADLNTALGRNVGDLNTALYPLAGTSAFHTAASMGSDFAHVGLGSPDFMSVYERLAGKSPGAVSASESEVAGSGEPQADGSQQGIVRVDLVDANGLPVGGKQVTITPNAGSSAVVSPSSVTTDATDGAAVFDVTDTTAETVTFTVKDTTDNVTLTTQPTLTFSTPVATGASIQASQANVPDDGTSSSTISVYLENSLGRPAAGKMVTLSEEGNAVITPSGSSSPGDTAITDADGYATFTVTDVNAESVQFMAVDTSDGNLPVPGTATVTFASGSPPTCSQTAPVPASGYGLNTFASPFETNPYAETLPGNFTESSCAAATPPAFDASGNAYVADFYTGSINVLPPGGGTASSSNALPDADYGSYDISGLVFDKHGDLFASLQLPPPAGVNDNEDPEVVQLDPSTGAIIRVIATQAQGVPYCPTTPAVDPLSGDLFLTGDCNGYLYSGQIVRISNPDSANPTITNYASLPGGWVGSALAFAPDGTLYAVANDPAANLEQITATDDPQPATVSNVTQFSSDYGDGLTLTGSNSSGAATSLVATTQTGIVTGTDGTVDSIDLSGQTPTTTAIVTPGGTDDDFSGIVEGPDGCLYAAASTVVDRIGTGSCASTGVASSAPSISLTESSGGATPATGSAAGFTAQLTNVSSPSGAPVHFTISGPNLGAKLVNASSGGQATMSYTGAFQGVDTVTASILVNGTTITSPPVQVHWTAGKDVTFLDLNASPEGGPVGRATTLTASLYDVSASAPVSGQPVTLSLEGRSCTATTIASGLASCTVTPTSIGLGSISASYGGSASYTASSGTQQFDATTGAPVDLALPKVAGTPLPGDKLTCSQGTWSNGPTSYAYQWLRNGHSIAGATKSSYVVTISDEGATLSCRVTAKNKQGSSSATSNGVIVAMKGTLDCPKPTGRLTATAIGPLRLGETKAAARKRMGHRRETRYGFDAFCLYGGWGIRVAYPSKEQLRSVAKRERAKLSGHVVIALTSNPFYKLDKIAPGAKLTKAVERKLKLGKVFKVGLNDWYIGSGRSSVSVLKVRHAEIQELGIANRQLNTTRSAQRRFLTSFRRG